MAKRKTGGRARRIARRDEESLLLKSAESIGRLIGALQRQIDNLAGHLPPSSKPTLRAPAARKKAKKSAPRKKR